MPRSGDVVKKYETILKENALGQDPDKYLLVALSLAPHAALLAVEYLDRAADLIYAQHVSDEEHRKRHTRNNE